MNLMQTRIAALAAALAIPTSIALGSIAVAQNAPHSAQGALATTTIAQAAPHADNDVETNDGPDNDNVEAGPGSADKETADGPETIDTPEPGDTPDAPAQRS